MRILSFSYCFPNHADPTWGIFVYQRLAALKKRDAVRVCSPVPWFPFLTTRRGDPGPEVDTWNGLDVFRPRFFYLPGVLKSGDARWYARGIRPWLLGLVEKWRPDVLDAHFAWPDGVGVAILARELGIPYVITLRGKLYECLKVNSQANQCGRALQGAAAVIGVSSKLAAEAKKLGAAERRLHVIPNGVDLGHFRPRDRARCRNLLDLPQEGRLLVTVAHLGRRKGHREVIQALAGLPPDVRLVLVGGPAQGGTSEQLQQIAKDKGVADRLILTGSQPYERVPLYFCAADASVLASYREGCPNAVLESLACGTPVVATDVGAVRDILRVPDMGRIVPPREVGALRAGLEETLDQAWDPDEIVRASGVRSWDEVGEEVRGVLKNAIHPRA